MNTLEICLLNLPGQTKSVDGVALSTEPDVRVRLLESPGHLDGADLLLVVGSGDFAADLMFMKQRDFTQDIVAFARIKGATVGLGYGYGLLGAHLSHADRPDQGVHGLGLLPIVTRYSKTTERQSARAEGLSGLIGTWCRGVQIVADDVVFGSVELLAGARPAFRIVERGGHSSEETNGVMQHGGWVFGTSLEGLFQHAVFRRRLLNALRIRRGMPALEP